MEDMVEGAQFHVYGDGVDLWLSDDRQQWQDAVIAEDPVGPRKQAGVSGEGGEGEGKD